MPPAPPPSAAATPPAAPPTHHPQPDDNPVRQTRIRCLAARQGRHRLSHAVRTPGRPPRRNIHSKVRRAPWPGAGTHHLLHRSLLTSPILLAGKGSGPILDLPVTN